MSTDDYDIGYGKPPRNQWKKGQSGNLSGRPKNKKSLDAYISQTLDKELLLKESNGAQKRVSKREALAIRLVNDALNGKFRQQELIVKCSSSSAVADPFRINEVDKAAFAKTLADIAAGQAINREEPDHEGG